MEDMEYVTKQILAARLFPSNEAEHDKEGASTPWKQNIIDIKVPHSLNQYIYSVTDQC